MSLFEELQDQMAKYRFRPEKKLSQFFCINESILDLMVEKAQLSKDDLVLEVGAGTGFLTKKLLAECKVIAIEKSPDMLQLLSEKFSKEISEGKLELAGGDALEQDFFALKANKMVSLPPYHISSKLVAKIVQSKIEKAVLMLDTGFLNKLIAFEGLMEYGALTVFANLNAQIDVVLPNVPGKEFFPPPGCGSAVVEINFLRKNVSNEFYFFLKELFRYKNKNLSRALKQARPFLEHKLQVRKDSMKKIEKLELADIKVNFMTPEELIRVFEAVTQKN
jgi:16S rRNA (adenine1518-N6/adenine1519-N6)-dimethyltransferase